MYYREATQKTISFLENTLTEECEFDALPNVTGYSKYHLLRIFKQETA